MLHEGLYCHPLYSILQLEIFGLLSKESET